MCAVFGVGEGHRMFQEDVLRWKCLAPHPFWEGSRGYVLRYKGDIAAFGCAVPCRFLTGSGTVASCDVIDWAASKMVPSAGMLLYKHILELAGTMINIGGTKDARGLLPKIGFQARVEIQHYTRVMRPWRLFRETSAKDWKSPLRLARDYRQLSRGAGRRGMPFKVRRVDRGNGIPDEAWPDPAVARQVVCTRTPELVDYFLACPAANMHAYVLEGERTPVGYFLLSRVAGECRIADLWLRSADGQAWTDAYAAATSLAADAGVTRISAAASLPLQKEALERAGYRQTDNEPVFIADPGRRLADRNDLALGLVENDGYYWSS